jgi:hypothetical protein
VLLPEAFWYWPAAHVKHRPSPALELYWPATQATQLVEPVALLIRPAAQAPHALALPAGWYCPVWHCWQAEDACALE